MSQTPPDLILTRSQITDAILDYLYKNALTLDKGDFIHFEYVTTPESITCEIRFVDEDEEDAPK